MARKKVDYSQYYSNRDAISFFSGAMGLDIGLEKAGLHIAIGQDLEMTCVETMRANGHNVLEGDIREIEPQRVLDLAGLDMGEPFLICGGPPPAIFNSGETVRD